MLINVARILLAIALLFVAAFCLFGFLATFEPGVKSASAWRTGYVAFGGGTLVCALWIGWIALSRVRSS